MPESRRRRLVLCALGEFEVAIAAALVVEVADCPPIVRIPGVPEVVLGLAQVRGRLVTVFDGRRLAGLPAAPGTRELLVLRLGRSLVALAVDRVKDVADLPESALVETRTAGPELLGTTATGEWATRAFAVLDVPGLLAPLLAAEAVPRQPLPAGGT